MGAFQAGLILMRIEKHPRVSELSGVDVLVLSTLFSFSTDDDIPLAYPSAAKVAARSRLAHRTVQRALERLEDVGMISGQHRHRHPTRWNLDPFLTKSRGVAATQDVAAVSAVRTGRETGKRDVTESQADDTTTQDTRQCDARVTSQRRTANATESHQGTEVGSGAQRRNPTEVPEGARSAEPARSAPRAPSAAPVGREHPPQGKPCTHGVPAGYRLDLRGKAKCSDCEDIAPDPRSDKFNKWCAAQGQAIVDVEVTCTNAAVEQVTRRLAMAKFNHALRRRGVREVAVMVPSEARLWHAMKAYAVDQIEPGRVTAFVAAHRQTR
jgi:hypothetical protein